MKKHLLFICVLPAMLLLAGCGHEVPEDKPEDLVVDDSAAPQEELPPTTDIPVLPSEFVLPYDPDVTLDPLTCPDGPHLTIAPLLYEGLFVLDEDFQPQPVLCASYESNAAMTEWIFRIRSDVLFSDGTPFTAADAAASLERARNVDRYRARLADVLKISVSGDAVTVTLSAPNALFPALLDIPIVKKSTAETSAPAGTGPYRFSLQEDKALLLPSKVWHGTDKLPVSQIRLTGSSGTSALHHQFSSHQIHLMTADLTSQNAYRPTGSTVIWDTDTTVLQYIGFNTASPLFSSPDLRHALGLGIDRQTLAGTLFSGHASAAQSPVSPCSPLYPYTLDTPYSPSSFREAMAAAGYDNGSRREATLLINSDNSFRVAAAEFLAKSLSVCDLKISVKALPWEEYTAALLVGDFDLYYGEVKLTSDWNLSSLVGTGGSMNFGGYSDTVMDFRLRDYASSYDPLAAMRHLCRYLQAQAPILPLAFKRTSVLTEDGIADGLSPTAANPFANLGSIDIHLADY